NSQIHRRKRHFLRRLSLFPVEKVISTAGVRKSRAAKAISTAGFRKSSAGEHLSIKEFDNSRAGEAKNDFRQAYCPPWGEARQVRNQTRLVSRQGDAHSILI